VSNIVCISDRGTWVHVSHAADVAVIGIGRSKAEAFRQAALALTATLTDPSQAVSTTAVPVHCRADSDELLVFEWLNALVTEMAAGGMVFRDFGVELGEGELNATAFGERIGNVRARPAAHIKAARLTALQWTRGSDEWRIQAIVDLRGGASMPVTATCADHPS
jgi:tRNA nucleotidyltransferase (CCA-adding enzyme)